MFVIVRTYCTPLNVTGTYYDFYNPRIIKYTDYVPGSLTLDSILQECFIPWREGMIFFNHIYANHITERKVDNSTII